MHLIYKINFPSGKVYIGQTNNLQKRKTDHLKEARNGTDYKVYRAMRKYNTTRKDFEIVETGIETQEEADDREIYWIAFYDSYHNGYNSTPGGNSGNSEINKGEKSPSALFTNEEVLEIRKLRAEMKYTKMEIYEKYKHKISEGGFNKIWNYNTYTDVGQELNTPEITSYYRHARPIGTNSSTGMFTEEQIADIRDKYFIDAISSKEISEIYEVNQSTIERIVSGKTYSNLPMPKPSFEYRRKKHKYTEEEFNELIDTFIDSEMDITNFHKDLITDISNIFSNYTLSPFRELIKKGLNARGLSYINNNKWGFKIVPIE